ncbi:unnamed protein product [Adineta ricciae]|uniref:Uncharacterized protein n=1 Tax=Adineta ricciae TaxID=249248 RepID=A0A815J0R5_ADIRI|nr:unnamed protein product [Adineta ricciae]
MSDAQVSLRSEKKYLTSYSDVSQEEAEEILGFKFNTFYRSQIPIENFITKSAPVELKRKIFDRLIDCIESEGFPEATIAPMNEAVITDNVGMILITIVSYYRRTMHRYDIELTREKQIISKDKEFGGNMEFVVTQIMNSANTRYLLVVEAKRDSLGKGLTQLLLTLKSMWNINDDHKMVYAFVTTAINWQLVTYDGQTWKLSDSSTILLGNMEQREEQWLENNTQLLDAIYTILSSI